MMCITLIAVGNLKEIYWKQAASEYMKRLSPFAKVSVVEVEEISFTKPSDKERVSKKEAGGIIRAIPKDAYVIAFEEKGREMDSMQFSKFLAAEGESGRPIVCILGGSLGLHSEIIKLSNCSLSLSPLTFTHRLARIVLLEQLYRAMTIIHGKQYHY